MEGDLKRQTVPGTSGNILRTLLEGQDVKSKSLMPELSAVDNFHKKRVSDGSSLVSIKQESGLDAHITEENDVVGKVDVDACNDACGSQLDKMECDTVDGSSSTMDTEVKFPGPTIARLPISCLRLNQPVDIYTKAGMPKEDIFCPTLTPPVDASSILKVPLFKIAKSQVQNSSQSTLSDISPYGAKDAKSSLPNLRDSVPIAKSDSSIVEGFERVATAPCSKLPQSNVDTTVVGPPSEVSNKEDGNSINLDLDQYRMGWKGPYMCTFCNKTFAHRGYFKTHLLTHRDGKAYHCSYCGRSFCNANTLKGHERIHTGEKPYHCAFCDKSFTQSGVLKKHERTHTGEKPHHCRFCDIGFSTGHALKQHGIKFHPEEDLYQCVLCELTFKEASLLKWHEKSHNIAKEKKHHCTECDMSFSLPSLLRLHQRKHVSDKPFKCRFCGIEFRYLNNCKIHESRHNGEKTYKCRFCDEHFVFFNDQRSHERTHGCDNDKPYQCRYCDQSFSQADLKKEHEQTHLDERPFQCSYCEKRFNRPHNLKMHEMIHTGEKPFKCQYCNKSYCVSSDLKRHERLHTGENLQYCRFCSKSFTNPGHLMRHERAHTGIKPYNCHYCDKSFKEVHHLQRHERTHTGERPYECEICKKCFSEPIALKYHQRTHTGEKPYQCEYCDRRFSLSSVLTTHRRIHTLEQPFKCRYCDRTFKQCGAMRYHERQHKSKVAQSEKNLDEDSHDCVDHAGQDEAIVSEKQFVCDICNQDFLSAGELEEHQQAHKVQSEGGLVNSSREVRVKFMDTPSGCNPPVAKGSLKSGAISDDSSYPGTSEATVENSGKSLIDAKDSGNPGHIQPGVKGIKRS